ncbi:MAG: acyltransferase family protein [Alphaproteobacteria bacterium]
MMALLSIQYLRGAAAMMVVLYHLHLHFERLGHAGGWPAWLASGVDVFFVISGCIMWITTWDRPAAPLGFYVKRIVRIVPLYWLLTGFMVALLIVAPQLLQSQRLEAGHVAASFLFLPWTHPVTGLPEPVLIPGWTLNYEMFFYAVFGLALLLPTGWRLPAVGGALGALVVLGALLQPASVALAFYTAPIVLEFVAGMMLGRLFTSGRTLPPAAAWTMMTAGWVAIPVASTLLPDAPRFLVWGVPATMIVAGALSIERSRGVAQSPLLRLVGDASYSIYLSHGIVMAALVRAWAAVFPMGSALTVVGFGIAATLAAAAGGIVLYLLVERPLGRAVRPSPAH